MSQPTNVEEWRPIPGYEGLYEASNLGNIRSLGRSVVRRNGTPYNRKGGLLSPKKGQKYAAYTLYDSVGKTRSVRGHRLVYIAFKGVIPEGAEVRHWDDNPRNNRVENLVIGSRSDNMKDAVRNGVHPVAKRTRCVNGHEFTADNTYVRGPNARGCKACRKQYRSDMHQRKLQAARDNGRAQKVYGGVCHMGHPFDEENTYFYPTGNRECKTCRRERDRKRRTVKRK